GDRPFPELQGRTVILVDDGMATGASMIAAVEALRTLSPRHIIVAVPVTSDTAVDAILRVADECVYVTMPQELSGIGWYYTDFSQTSDREVLDLLRRVAPHRS